MINWHRLFGIFLTDYFTDTPYSVELEKDLSIKQQLLDVVILKKEPGNYHAILPDGLENLTTHNLLSYKSMRESFDSWAILELIGHYVNYRKQITEPLLPVSEFNLYAVSTRFPTGLAKQVQLIKLKPGVYEIKGLCYIRLIVLSQIAKSEHNAIWHLFSSRLDKVKYGAKEYHPKFNLSSSVNLLYDYYDAEGLMMAYTMEEFQKDVAREYLHYLSADEILKQVSIEERLKGLSANERLKDLPVNERLAGLSKEDVMKYFQQVEQKDNKSNL
jgi:hypothetical protein